ncbi:MAG: RpiB/LacA/LacB family sugar-phosphate isomerase [Prevotellaceae bacterium]|jgi:ribose 5-phosphate isomerase B|nr:RpiB/LacA/LacB family sugar-phosphate isomerase [Prevotellaceae bacterium]
MTNSNRSENQERISTLTPEDKEAIDEMIREDAYLNGMYDEDNLDLDRLIGLTSDHAGHKMRHALCARLKKEGYMVADYGPISDCSVDYTDYAHSMAIDIDHGELKRGIALCYTGNGMNMALNRHNSVRSALCWNTEIARLAREHNDANVCTLPANFVSPTEAENIMMTFIDTAFSNERRHARRVAKINADYENTNMEIEKVLTEIDNENIKKGITSQNHKI